MSIMLPDELEWVLEMLGFYWPTADEDKLVQSAEVWENFAQDAIKLHGDTNRSASTVLSHNTGDSIDAFQNTYGKYDGGDGHLQNAAQAALSIAMALRSAAMVVQVCKYAVIAQLIALAIEFIAAQAAAPFTLGLSELAAVGATAAARIVVRRLLQELRQALTDAILECLKEPAVSAVESMVTDLTRQSVNVGFGAQNGYDLGATVKAGAEGGWAAVKQTPQTFLEGLRDSAGSKAGGAARDGLDNHLNTNSPFRDGAPASGPPGASADGGTSSSSSSSDSSTGTGTGPGIGGTVSADTGDGALPGPGLGAGPDSGSGSDSSGGSDSGGSHDYPVPAPRSDGPSLSDFDSPSPSTPLDTGGSGASPGGGGSTPGGPGSSGPGGISSPNAQSTPGGSTSSSSTESGGSGSIRTQIDSLAASTPTQTASAPTPTASEPASSTPRADGGGMPTSPTPASTGDAGAGGRTGTNTASSSSSSGQGGAPTSPNPSSSNPARSTPSGVAGGSPTTPSAASPTAPASTPRSTPSPTASTQSSPASPATPATSGGRAPSTPHQGAAPSAPAGARPAPTAPSGTTAPHPGPSQSNPSPAHTPGTTPNPNQPNSSPLTQPGTQSTGSPPSTQPHTAVPAPKADDQPSDPEAPAGPEADSGEATEDDAPKTDGLHDIRADLDHEPGGLGPVAPDDQSALENAVPRNPDGTPQRFPDPFGPWSGLQNDGGNEVPGRGNNCADCSRSFLETWRGNPQVSAPRTLDLDEHGNYDGYTPEDDGNENQIRWSGAPHTYAGTGDDPYTAARIEYDLLQAGHGSSAIVQVDWPNGDGGHAFNAVNHNGSIVWIDPQLGEVSHDPLHIVNAARVFHIPMDPDGNPLHPAQPETALSDQQDDDGKQDTAHTDGQADPSSSASQHNGIATDTNAPEPDDRTENDGRQTSSDSTGEGGPTATRTASHSPVTDPAPEASREATPNREPSQQGTPSSDPRTSTVPHQQGTVDPRPAESRPADRRPSDSGPAAPRPTDAHSSAPARDAAASESGPDTTRTPEHDDGPNAEPVGESLPDGRSSEASRYIEDSVGASTALYGFIDLPVPTDRQAAPAAPSGRANDPAELQRRREADAQKLAWTNSDETEHQKWFKKYYQKNGHRIRVDRLCEDGYPAPQLHPGSAPNRWMLANDVPDAQKEDYTGWTPDPDRDTRLSPEIRRRLDKAAKEREDAINADRQPHRDMQAAKKAYEEGMTPEARQAYEAAKAKHSPLHADMTRKIETYGEEVAEFHAVPENFPDAVRIDDRETGNDRFDQIWQLPGDPPEFLVVEAKGGTAPKPELGVRRGLPTDPHAATAGVPDQQRDADQSAQDTPRSPIPKVKQGTRGYFETILHEMEERAERNLQRATTDSERDAAKEEGLQAEQLEQALTSSRVRYMLVKAVGDENEHKGYDMKEFDIRAEGDETA